MTGKRGGSLQVQVFAGRDPLTGRKRWLSRQVDGQTRAAWRQANMGPSCRACRKVAPRK